jgi:hypothetical protein
MMIRTHIINTTQSRDTNPSQQSESSECRQTVPIQYKVDDGGAIVDELNELSSLIIQR